MILEILDRFDCDLCGGPAVALAWFGGVWGPRCLDHCDDADRVECGLDGHGWHDCPFRVKGKTEA